jgi:hypothetical protein
MVSATHVVSATHHIVHRDGHALIQSDGRREVLPIKLQTLLLTTILLLLLLLLLLLRIPLLLLPLLRILLRSLTTLFDTTRMYSSSHGHAKHNTR